MINYFVIFVLGVNNIVCLPQSNRHEFNLNVTDENDNKGSEDGRSFRNDKLKNQDENTVEIIDINGKVDKDVLNINEGMHINQRLIPIYHGQEADAVPPVHSRYIIPIVPNASEQIVTASYDTPFKKEVREPEVVAKPHIEEEINKNPTINPVETVYVVPPQNIAYTPGPDEAIIPTPYLAPIPVDPDIYNFQETGVPNKPLTYRSPFVQHRYFSINGPQPYYYRHPVYPLPKYTPSINYGTIRYQELLPSTTAEERITGYLQEQGPGNNNKVGNKHQIIVENQNDTKLNADIPEYRTDFVRNFSDESANIVKDRDNTNQNSQQDNSFESSDFDTTKISGYVYPDASYDLNNFDDRYPMYFVSNIRQRHPQAIYSSYQNPKAKETPENAMKHSDNLGSIHNDDKVTHELIAFEQNHQHAKNSTIIERKGKNQEFDYIDNTNQSENMLVDSVRKERIESNNPVLNDKIESRDITTDTHIILTDNTQKLSEVPLITDRGDKNQESHDITNITKDHKVSSETSSTETKTKINDVDNKTTGTDIYEKDIKIETTTYRHNHDIDTPQIEAPLDDSDKLILNNGNRSTVGIKTDFENTNIKITTDENIFIDKNEMYSNSTNEISTHNKEEFNITNDVQATESREKKIGNGGQQSAEYCVEEDTTSRDDTKYNVEINIHKTQNIPASPDKLIYENSSENYYKEEVKSNTENNEEYNIEFESTLSETTSDNRNRQESDEKYVKPSLDNPEKFVNPIVKRIDTESSIDQNTNKIPVGQKEDTEEGCNDKDNIENEKDINLHPKIPRNHEVAKFKKHGINYSNSENVSKFTDDKYIEEDTTVSEKNSNPERDTFAPSDSNRDNDDDLIDSDEDFDEISRPLQTSSEESIKSKLGFSTTCIRHPVDISMSDDNSKLASELMGLEFYKKLFEEYCKNHNAIPLTVIQKDIRSFVYKNGTLINVITKAVWDIESDEKPVEITTRKTIKQRKKKTSKRN